ncbi:MAG: hypothetical protein M1830_010597 [Pleopsidium flavum]|nr:MAG: hypothetical protein M1830_010597 [Pleopsidium flavum]
MFRLTTVALTPPVQAFPLLPAPKSYVQQKIDKAVETSETELWFLKKLLWESKEHGHLVEEVQTVVDACRVAAGKLHEKRAWIAANRWKIDAGAAAQERLEAQNEMMMEKDAELLDRKTAQATLAAESEELRGVVMDVMSAQTQHTTVAMKLAADQTKLCAAHKKLTAENAQLRKNLATVHLAFRKMLVAAKRYGSGHPKVVSGNRKGKALRKPSSSIKGLCGGVKKRSRSVRK